MKKIITLILFIFFITSCKNHNEDTNVENKTIKISKKNATSKENPQKSSTYLCKINGKDWGYTKASGIISTHPRTKKRTAIITFKKKLEKGSESIQLHYDANSFELKEASLQLKFKKKNGKLFTCFYDLKPETKKKSPQGEMSGTIDLSDNLKASGVAEVHNVHIKFEKESLLNPENEYVTVTDLKFKDIGYSDIDKLSNKFK